MCDVVDVLRVNRRIRSVLGAHRSGRESTHRLNMTGNLGLPGGKRV
jgi:hypothetical protein